MNRSRRLNEEFNHFVKMLLPLAHRRGWLCRQGNHELPGRKSILLISDGFRIIAATIRIATTGRSWPSGV